VDILESPNAKPLFIHKHFIYTWPAVKAPFDIGSITSWR